MICFIKIDPETRIPLERGSHPSKWPQGSILETGAIPCHGKAAPSSTGAGTMLQAHGAGVHGQDRSGGQRFREFAIDIGLPSGV
jgi:hypothetical protein